MIIAHTICHRGVYYAALGTAAKPFVTKTYMHDCGVCEISKKAASNNNNNINYI